MSKASQQSPLAAKRAVDCLWHKHSGRTGKQVRAAALAKREASILANASSYTVISTPAGYRVLDTEELALTGDRSKSDSATAKRLVFDLLLAGASLA